MPRNARAARRPARTIVERGAPEAREPRRPAVPGRPRLPRSDAAATRARIIAAAERLLAERGVDAVSLREINAAAGQSNKSALQYHFASKAGLIESILDKHTPGIERRRHEMLDAIEAAGPPDLRSLTRALVEPIAEKLDDRDGGVAFVRLNAQLIGHPTLPLLGLAERRVNRGAERLVRLVAGAAPEIPEELRVSRWLLVTGLLFHAIADYSRLGARRGGALALPSRELFVANLVDSSMALYAAPVSPETRALLARAPRAAGAASGRGSGRARSRPPRLGGRKRRP